jgi:spore maturation protein CgeB
MRIVLFYHSLVSDWNHGNAHFLRGVATELIDRGHDVTIWEPEDAWSLVNLVQDHGTAPLAEFERRFPQLRSRGYHLDTLDLDEALDHADLVLVHEWNTPELIARIGEHRSQARSYRLLFHDTHHRMVTSPEEMARFDLRHYDGVLAFGRVIRDLYVSRGLAQHAWTWHEAADTRVFYPSGASSEPAEGELIWIGNWGDEERTEELHEYLMRPVAELGLNARVHGVRYPMHALRALEDCGIEYGGWVPNYRVPELFARHLVTVHVPRRPYARALAGIPTIRVFEALACGIPLISAPWEDAEHLFAPGEDFLMASDGKKMREMLKAVIFDPDFAKQLATHGRETILRRHTCAHRVEELLEIEQSLRSSRTTTTRGLEDRIEWARA